MFRNLLIVVAIFGLGWGASFGAGVAFGRRQVPAAVQAASPIGQLAGGQFSGQGGQAGQQGGQQGGRNTAIGTVEKVDGKTLTLSEGNNRQVQVTLTDQTQITKQAPGTPADLTPGTRVVVVASGQPAAGGAITAASVSVLPEGMELPGLQGAAQRQQGGGAQGQRQQGGGQRQQNG